MDLIEYEICEFVITSVIVFDKLWDHLTKLIFITLFYTMR